MVNLGNVLIRGAISEYTVGELLYRIKLPGKHDQD